MPGGVAGRRACGGVFAEAFGVGVHQLGDLGEVGAVFGVGDRGDACRPRLGRKRDQGAGPVPDAGVEDGRDGTGQPAGGGVSAVS